MAADHSSSTDPPASERRLLVLMRHAKSDWANESLSDHERPLNDRGQRDAPRMARWLHDVDAVPDRVLSSTAQRTRETVSLMLPEWASEPAICFDESLYLAAPQTMLNAVRRDGGEARVLMVLAHNPGVAHAASELAQQGIDMATAAIAIFEVSVADWRQWQPAAECRLIHFMRPKAL